MEMNSKTTVAVGYGLLFLCASFTLLQALSEKSQDNIIPNVGHHYPVDIGAEGHVVQGRVSSKAEPGEKISSDVVLEGREDADDTVHLRVEIRASVYRRPHVYHPDIKINTTDPGNPQFEHPIILFENSTLPYGMEFVVVHSNAFYVDKDRYIVVNDFSHLDGETRVHFDVILKDKLSETHYVSNQLPFVVEIDYPKREKNPHAALFAGVLVITIVAISLLIPFVVRAKRRSKAGKPICGCGSADVASDKESLENQGKQKGTPMGKTNLAMILDNGRMVQSTSRTSMDDYLTIQDRMMRSTSSLHLQPQWMDPHYNDIYRRPDFNNPRVHPASRLAKGSPIHPGLAMARDSDVHSISSSVSSLNHHPLHYQKNGQDVRKGSTESLGLATNGGISFLTNGTSKTANGDVATSLNGVAGKSTIVMMNGVHGVDLRNGDAPNVNEQNAAAGGGDSDKEDDGIKDARL